MSSDSSEPASGLRLARWQAVLGPALGVVLFSLAVAILHRELATIHLRDILAHFRAIPRSQVALALAITLVSYSALTGYDWLSFRFLRRPLALPRIALASFVGFVFSHNVGLSFFGGTAVRYRILTSYGVKPGDVARVTALNLVTFWMGFFALGAAVLTFDPIPLPAPVHAVLPTSRPLGLALAAALIAYLVWSLRRRAPVDIQGFEVEIPGPGMTAAQLALSCVDWLLAASVLYALLPADAGVSFPQLLGAYLLAQVIGLASHVPAGLGVFDSMMVLLLAPQLPGDVVLGSVFAYRVIYYLLPLGLAVGLLGGFEAFQRRRHLERLQDLVERWLPPVVPRAFAAAMLVAGAILLVSGATPGVPARMHALQRLVPLPVVETSHLVASAIGVALVLLARAVQQRVDAAWFLSLLLLAAGAVASLFKGLDWEEAAVLTGTLLALLPCRAYFHRRSSLFAQPFSIGWILGVAALMAGVVGVTLLAYRRVDYSTHLWLSFGFSHDAPRSLRSLALAIGLLAAYAVARQLRPTPPSPAAPSAGDLERAAAIVAEAPRAVAHLALLGDKQLLFHESGKAFLMYGVGGRSWVSMGDPVGPPRERQELAWRFRELADLHHGRTVFYEVSSTDLPTYVDLGLDLFKLGEEARVSLADFTLEGSTRKALRYARSRLARDGCSFEIVPAAGVPPLLDQVQAISDAWLKEKRTREKRFSLGFFDRTYLARTPLALVRHRGRIVAFANLWLGAKLEEVSVDLMRQVPDAPPGVMEYLFTELVLWSQAQGYRWYSLGIAPFSGFERHRLAPLWNKLGALLFQHGEHFYNFRGLRSFKEKFHPVWEPRYLAAPGSLTLPLVLTQVAALVSSGVSGVVAR